jgi:DNA-binding transcriptional LysR family regulator
MGLVREGHPLLSGRLTVKRFAAERHVALAARPGEASPVDTALARLGMKRSVALSVPNAYGAAVIASRSPLVACLPQRMAQALKSGLKLTTFELPLEVPTDPVLMAWHPRHGADAAHMAFRDLLQQVLTDPAWVAPPATSIRRATQAPVKEGVRPGARGRAAAG